MVLKPFCQRPSWDALLISLGRGISLSGIKFEPLACWEGEAKMEAIHGCIVKENFDQLIGCAIFVGRLQFFCFFTAYWGCNLINSYSRGWLVFLLLLTRLTKDKLVTVVKHAAEKEALRSCPKDLFSLPHFVFEHPAWWNVLKISKACTLVLNCFGFSHWKVLLWCLFSAFIEFKQLMRVTLQRNMVRLHWSLDTYADFGQLQFAAVAFRGTASHFLNSLWLFFVFSCLQACLVVFMELASVGGLNTNSLVKSII